MSEKHLILKSEASDDDFPLQVKTPTRGPLAVDVTRLYSERGLFTYDPGFMSTAIFAALTRMVPPSGIA